MGTESFHERNHSWNGITPGLGSSLPSLFDSVLAAFSCSFCPLFLVGRWQPAALSNTKKKVILFANRANRSPQIEPLDVLGSVSLSAAVTVTTGIQLAHMD